MKFADFVPFLLQLLSDLVRALIFSWFPQVHPNQDVPQDVLLELAGLRRDMHDAKMMIEAMMIVIQAPALGSQESLSELLKSVATALQANTLATQEQTNEFKGLRAAFQEASKTLDQNSEQMTAMLMKMRDAFSKLTELGSASPKAPGVGMHGPSGDSQGSR